MQFVEMQAAFKDMVGDQNGIQFTATIIKRYLNWAQRYVAGQTETTELTTTITTLDSTHVAGGVTLPGSFLRPIKVIWSGTVLAQVDRSSVYPDMNSIVPEISTPQGYFVTNFFLNSPSKYRRMEFYPAQTPGQTGLSIVIQYVSYPVDLASDTDVSPLHEGLHDVVVMAAVAKSKLQENDYTGYKFIMDYEVKERLAQVEYEMSTATGDSFGSIRNDSDLFDTTDYRVW